MLKISLLVVTAMMLAANEIRAGERSVYDFLWLDPDKSVYVLQNKVHKKERSLYLDLGYLANFTSKFQDTQGVGLRGGYYIHEEWGIELFYNQYSNKNNDDYRNVRLINQAEPFIRRLNSSYGAIAIWSPFYGKINTFNHIFYFDWSFGAGITRVNTESNLQNVRNPAADSSFENETHTGAVLKTGLKFHIQEDVHLGLEYMNLYYRAPRPRDPKSDTLKTNTDIMFSIGFSY
jgi:outer membrane beta-barrel protein